MTKHSKKIVKKGDLTAKLTFFDWGWADNVVFSVKAKVSEKYKGLQMIERIKMFFGISNKEIVRNEEDNLKTEIAEIKGNKSKIKWTRDEEGNITSPFKSKKWT